MCLSSMPSIKSTGKQSQLHYLGIAAEVGHYTDHLELLYARCKYSQNYTKL